MKEGDLVKLKSGGPQMVIIEDQGDNEFGHWFTCEYYDGVHQKKVDCLETSLVSITESDIINH